METNEYLDQYEKSLLVELLRYCTERKLMNGRLPETPDINEMWSTIGESYIADAMKEIAKYPMVALGWAVYLGMGIAKYWEDDWATYSKHPNLYEHLRDVRGFDYMDEVVREDLYGLKNAPDANGRNPFTDCEELVRTLSQMTIDKIRHENIEPSSPMAYHVFIRSCGVLYRMGAAIGLRKLGYNMEAI